MMRPVPKDHTHLWNDLPFEERMRLMPYQIEAQILTIEQMRAKAVTAHQHHMNQIDVWVKNLKHSLNKLSTKGEADAK